MPDEPIPGASGNEGSEPPAQKQQIQSSQPTKFSKAQARQAIEKLFSREKSPPPSQPTDPIKEALTLSRRAFMKAFLMTSAAVATPEILAAIDRYWQEIGSTITGNVVDLDQVKSEVPPTLLLKKEEKIPTENRLFRSADAIFREGLERYELLRLTSGVPLPELHYTEPPNYLTLEKVAAILGNDIAKNPKSLLGGISPILNDLYVITDANDQPYSKFFSGSAANFNGIQDIVINDPGTGIVRALQESMKEEFGPDFDVLTACNNVLPEKQQRFITDKLRDWFFTAKKSIENERRGGKMSTSVLFGYFLGQNKGDILASIWDTSTWLKILTRNDPDKGFVYDASYARAKAATDLFNDEFSRTISANWVVEHVNPDDEVLNYADITHPDAYPHFKDFMPPNRAGGFYHAWNIMALSLCMDEPLVTRMVATHTQPFDSAVTGEKITEYGKVKTEADMLVAKKAEEIGAIAKQYERSPLKGTAE